MAFAILTKLSFLMMSEGGENKYAKTKYKDKWWEEKVGSTDIVH
jgi:hypothetical protein